MIRAVTNLIELRKAEHIGMKLPVMHELADLHLVPSRRQGQRVAAEPRRGGFRGKRVSQQTAFLNRPDALHITRNKRHPALR